HTGLFWYHIYAHQFGSLHDHLCFFFQAEDGIRDADVEFRRVLFRSVFLDRLHVDARRQPPGDLLPRLAAVPRAVDVRLVVLELRSEERRVGKECRLGGSPDAEKKKEDSCVHVSSTRSTDKESQTKPA